VLRLGALVLLASCAAAPAVVAGRSPACQQDYERCNNACFRAPHYKVNGPQCAQTSSFEVCPQQDQLIDTLAAGKCFEACEWNVKACTAPPPPKQL
jgi:hypothetical protein